MTTQQMNYMRYQQMRQSAMRAYVAAKAQEPVPPSPKRQVVLTTVKADGVTPLPAPGVTVAECDPVSWTQIPSRQATGTGTVSYEADSAAGIRPAVPIGFENGGYVYEFTGFTVNGQPAQAGGGRPFSAYWTDVVPGTGALDVKASYSETPLMKHVSLSAVEAGTDIPLGATVSIQEYSGHDPEVPGRKVQATYNVSADVQPGNWVRVRSTWVFDGRGISAFVVDGVVKEAQTEPDVWSTMYVDVTPDSDRTEILAVYG